MPTLKNVKRNLYMGLNEASSSIVLKSGADLWVFDPSFDKDEMEKTCSITITLPVKEQPEPNPSESKSSEFRCEDSGGPHIDSGSGGGSNLPPVWGLTSKSARLPLSAKEDSGDTEVYIVKLTEKAKDTATSTNTGIIKTWKIVVVDSSETDKRYTIKVDGHTEWMLGADEKTTMVVLRKASEDDTRFHWHIK
ncbi:hypothetical protein BC629DRAFT_1540008 [Irpex lacteus]|nr:hypothetical protein BC629DRAFT_1540008 [Irpex lacteus]